MFVDLHIFKAQVGMFEPTALQDHNVCIRYLQEKHYRKVAFLESIPPFQCIDLCAAPPLAVAAALAAATVSARVDILNLDMPDGEFGLFRWYLLDNAQIRLFHPRGTSKFQLKNLQVPVDYKTIERDPNLVSTELAVWQDNRPAVEAINGQAYPLNAVRIVALGYRFRTITPQPTTLDEIKVVNQMKGEAQYAGKKDIDLLELAFEQGRLPVTDVWCSGFGASSR